MKQIIFNNITTKSQQQVAQSFLKFVQKVLQTDPQAVIVCYKARKVKEPKPKMLSQGKEK